jgi:hypothetical protein
MGGDRKSAAIREDCIFIQSSTVGKRLLLDLRLAAFAQAAGRSPGFVRLLARTAPRRPGEGVDGGDFN